MLKKLILENWKSFRYAELYFDPLTVLIGTNASGKSNLVEALEFLRRMATGETVDVALNGDRSLPPIRGGSQGIIFKSEHDEAGNGKNFTVNLLIQNEQQIEYLYRLNIGPVLTALPQNFNIREEDITWNKNQNKVSLSGTNFGLPTSTSGLSVDYNLLALNDKIENQELVSDLQSFFINREVWDKAKSEKASLSIFILEQLKSIFIMNPIPSQMRNYTQISETLEQDGSNLAGVLAALPDEQKEEVEATLSHYLEHFPEGDIKKVWAEKVGRLGTDAMLYCQEEWKPGEITEIDARSMSDGTLRLLGILTALLTRPEGSLIVIEEIDNGLHPSRAELLVKILREIGTKRKIDLLITTHNPALLDALGPEIIPFVTVVHRDAETGESKLTLLEDIDNLPKLLASGSLGKLATRGTIEKTLANSL